MGERIVIQTWPGAHRVYTRARLRQVGSTTTPVGEDLDARLAGVDGCEVLSVGPHDFSYKSIHPALWSDDEVEAGVLDALCSTLGVGGGELDVVREDRRAEGNAMARRLDGMR